ncbi:YqiJ family protein [Aurantiacibacter sp. D1-12]|uniref:YqiJ family protein n=1 Tax=Aurantiacibacter sp. D1-12 TaxID=2993658 RepID=UPI00237CC544|nr:YqiJ family protein [Aurantiacibacter sp. D1-12]MDE1468433.1 YqiJ family protein [Aurantiacibacter sp. D1-12]
MSLFADYNLPFAIALGVMALLTLLQVIGLGDFDFGADVDLDVDVDGEIADPTSAGLGGAITTLLGLGKVPVFVWLIVYLLLFAVIGMGVQALASDMTGAPLFAWLAALISGGASIPVTAAVVRPIGALLPKDETTAVGLQSLVGRRGTITTGRAEKGSPARARVRDHHGHAHYVMVEPHEDASVIPAGDEVLLVRREGNVFFGVPLAERKLAPMS